MLSSSQIRKMIEEHDAKVAEEKKQRLTEVHAAGSQAIQSSFSTTGVSAMPTMKFGFTTDSSYEFDSPVSTMDTIQTITNLIAGATRNFNSLYSILEEGNFNTHRADLTAIPNYSME